MINNKALNIKRLLVLAVFVVSSLLCAQDGDAAKGAAVFQKNCTSCHKIGSKLVGPDLTGVTKKYDAAWLQKWITNNEAFIASGDAKAVEASKFDPSAMTVFEGTLSEQDVKDVITWLADPVMPDTDKDGVTDDVDKCPDVAGDQPDGCKAVAVATQEEGSLPLKMIVISFGIIAILLAWMLYKVFTLLQVMKETTGIDLQAGEPKGLKGFLEKNVVLVRTLVAIFAIIGFYNLYSWMLNIDVNKGYTPDQPIYFSHKVHAGDNGIDCQYCHSSARQSKTSGIPSANVCMNCHKSINEFKGKLDNKDIDGTKEMQKIYEHTGYDVKQLKYTGESKPIEWVRIHNMQDFVYFNHSQHVVAGEAAIKKAIAAGTVPGSAEANPEKDNSQVCFACHGRVDKMEKLGMANDFTMGWCIECHRTTGVEGVNGGAYYKAHDYDKMHELAKKAHGNDKNDMQTVAEIGGLECGKCHY